MVCKLDYHWQWNEINPSNMYPFVRSSVSDVLDNYTVAVHGYMK